MTTTTFSNNVTVTDEDWFNDVNRLHYTIFSDPADLAAVKATLHAAPGAIGGTTPASGGFTSASFTGNISIANAGSGQGVFANGSTSADFGSAISGLGVKHSSTDGAAIILKRTTAGPTLMNEVTFMGDGATTIGTIQTDGTNTAYNTTSDERLKHKFDEAKVNWGAKIDALWVGDFEFKGAPNTVRLGVRAQQAQPVYPQAISKPEKESDTWGADYSQLAPLALWGVKDLRGRIVELESKIAELEAKLAGT